MHIKQHKYAKNMLKTKNKAYIHNKTKIKKIKNKK